jgi:phosphoglycolate phosphatase-like HAD superfamily hydrolase
VLFELEHTLLDRRPAWQYAFEQAVGTVCHERIDARDLAENYAHRPVMHALAVVTDDLGVRVECARRWEQLFYRSAMKKLMVHDGVTMMLDRMRHAGIELGVISHEPHTVARKELESTGLDRFLTVLAAQPIDATWLPGERIEQCRTFLEYPPEEICLISWDEDDVDAAEGMGALALRASWPTAEVGETGIVHPSQALGIVQRAWDWAHEAD